LDVFFVSIIPYLLTKRIPFFLVGFKDPLAPGASRLFFFF